MSGPPKYIKVRLYEPIPIARAFGEAQTPRKATRPEPAAQGARPQDSTAARPGATCKNMDSGRRAR